MFGSVSHKPDIHCNVGRVVTGRAIMDYKKEIIEMIQKIDSEKFIKFLYNMIVSFKNQWGY